MQSIAIIAFVAAIGFSMTACHQDENNGLRTSVQVGASGVRAISSGSNIELYINELYYQHDEPNSGFIFLISDGFGWGDGGKLIENAGWYSLTEDLGYRTTPFNGKHSSLIIQLSGIKVGGVEYMGFPVNKEALLGKQILHMGSPHNDTIGGYSDNFDSITITDFTVSLKTIITIEPDILVDDGNGGQKLADNPYKFIKVEGRINE